MVHFLKPISIVSGSSKRYVCELLGLYSDARGRYFAQKTNYLHTKIGILLPIDNKHSDINIQ